MNAIASPIASARFSDAPMRVLTPALSNNIQAVNRVLRILGALNCPVRGQNLNHTGGRPVITLLRGDRRLRKLADMVRTGFGDEGIWTIARIHDVDVRWPTAVEAGGNGAKVPVDSAQAEASSHDE